MESIRIGRQWGWVSVLFAVLALAQAGLHIEETDMLHLAPDIYNEGPLSVDLYTVYSTGLSKLGHRKSKSSETKKFVEIKLTNQPPRPLLIATPEAAGEYPVVVLQHGFTLKNTFYSQLLKHVASYGFIAVAPQMYLFSGSDTTDEICAAASIIDWFPGGLPEALSKRVKSVLPDLDKVALVGHSRGGKVVFGLATGVCKTAVKFSAIAGLDPVDGMGVDQQTKPPILQFSEHSLKLEIPTLIVGAGLGPLKRNIFFPPCAPEGVSHEAFFFESDRPSFHFVALEYGHMDYMDDNCGGIQGVLSYCVCKNGPSREPMRKFSAGILVAFLRASLCKDSSQLAAVIANPSEAPVKLEKPEIYGDISDFLAARK
jgi:chlorophyllase